MSELTIKDFAKFVREKYHVSNNPIANLSLSRVEKLSDELSDLIIGDVKVNLNDYPKVMTAFKAIANNLLKVEVFNKAFDEAENFISV